MIANHAAASKPIYTARRFNEDRVWFSFVALRSCRFKRIFTSSLRSSSVHFSLSSSRSIIFLTPRLSLRGCAEVLLHRLLQSAYLGCDVGFADPHPARDFLLAVPVQVKQNEPFVQGVKFLNKLKKKLFLL